MSQKHEAQTGIFFSYALLHMNSMQYKNWFGHLIGTYSKCHKY